MVEVYGNVDGVRDASRNRSPARKAVKAAADAITCMADAEFAAILAAVFAGRGRITSAHLKAAILDLKLQPKRGK